MLDVDAIRKKWQGTADHHQFTVRELSRDLRAALDEVERVRDENTRLVCRDWRSNQWHDELLATQADNTRLRADVERQTTQNGLLVELLGKMNRHVAALSRNPSAFTLDMLRAIKPQPTPPADPPCVAAVAEALHMAGYAGLEPAQELARALHDKGLCKCGRT